MTTAKKKVTKKKVKRKAGQPTKFNEKVKKKIKFLVARGIAEKDIADLLDVRQQTFSNWKIQHPKFFEALKDWRIDADAKVEASMYESACGYSHPEYRTHYDQERKEWVKCVVTKHFPPNMTAAIFWLKNRQPEKWKDKREYDVVEKVVKIERKRFDGEESS